MHIVLAGATGFIGCALQTELSRQGHRLTILTRGRARKDGRAAYITWQPEAPSEGWAAALDGADAVINLAGASIAQRWTPAVQQQIRDSRLTATRAIGGAIARAIRKPRLLINASAVGYYGPRGDETLTETAPSGSGFLAEVCRDWEQAAAAIGAQGVRVVRLRTGVVLGQGGGALAKMVPPFKLFLGGPLGSGAQWMSWVQLSDVTGLIAFLLQHPSASGPVNATAPNPARMREVCRALGRALHRPSWAPVPGCLLKLVLGEMAQEMLLTGQRVLPQRAQQLGYVFRYPTLAEAMKVSVT